MHFLISSIIEIFQSSGNSAAQSIAEKLGHVPDHGFTERFPPMPTVEHLSTTLLMPDAHAFTADINAVVDYLPWGRLAAHPPPGVKASGRTFCQLAGPEGPIKDDSFRMGVYFQSPDTDYASHWHNAEEIYFVLSGTAQWQKDKAPFAGQKPGTLIHHLPNQPHAMRTQKEPLLALWGWLGDIGFESYRIE
jgi:quercetin dioxygenase-like cupin family protein